MKGPPALIFPIFALVAGVVAFPAQAMLDDNENGMSDVWEAAYGEGRVPGADEDGDGYTNREESIAGTDPMDLASCPVLAGVEQMNGSTIGQRWPSIGGVRYQPLASADLVSWVPIGDQVVGTGGMIDVALDVGSAFSSGGVRRRKWSGLTDEGVSDLRIMARTGTVAPDVDDRLTSLRTRQTSPDEDEYGQAITGFIVPPTTGDYTFWIAGDDASEFRLSTDGTAANAGRIARIPNWSDELEFTKNAAQKSAPIPLVAGSAYYFEVLQREYDGGDHVAVAWTKPGDAADSREIIGGAALSSTGDSIANLLADGRIFFRLEVADADADGDGLTDWEEVVLGLDAGDSTTKPNVPDKPAARARVASPSVVTLGVAVDRAYEADGTAARFKIFRSGGICPISVGYTLSGTAAKGVDYVDPGSSVTVGVAEGSAAVSIAPLADGEIEVPEGVTMTLLPGPGYALGSPTSTSVTIDDSRDVLYVAQLRGVVGSGGSGIASVRRAGNALGSRVALSFTGLATAETAAEIFHSTTGTAGPTVLTLPGNQVVGENWDFAPAAGFSSAQIVSALDAGQLWVRVRTEGAPEGEIVGQLRTTPAFETMPPTETPPVALAGATTDAEAARFLAQATFGATDGSVTEVRAGDFARWIDSQIALPATHHVDYVTARRAELEALNGNDGYHRPREEAFWQAALAAPDQLRQRMALALSEMLVISQVGSLEGDHVAVTEYYDALVDGAFGNYRDLLETVTKSPMMGQYLSMMRNRKPDPETGSEPDENYAREIMQLFTIGLTKLHTDGSIRLSSEGLPIPTYSQDDIVELAHVFTGWGPHYDEADPPRWNDGDVADRRGWFLYGYDDTRPMTHYADFGDERPRTILGGTVIPGDVGGEARMAAALDALFDHPNVGPFIARHLIQRFVTSNPSPGYTYRVARAFNGEAGAARGDLGATIRAVLLDPEARNVGPRTSISFGKGSEPLLRMARMFRATDVKPPLLEINGDDRYFIEIRYRMSEQSVLAAPSVFNFFLPSYSAPGVVSESGLVSPEYQILTDTTIINQANLMSIYLDYGLWTPQLIPGTTSNAYLRADYTRLVAILDDPDRTRLEAESDLIDHLDARLLFGAMSPELRASIQAAFAALPSWYGYEPDRQKRRAEMAVFLVLTSPEGFVQR